MPVGHLGAYLAGKLYVYFELKREYWARELKKTSMGSKNMDTENGIWVGMWSILM